MKTRFYSLYQQQGKAPKTDSPAPPPAITWPATYHGGLTEIDPSTWQLKITGLVAEEKTFTAEALQSLGKTTKSRRVVSADGWSYRAEWEGIPLSVLIPAIEPKPEARFICQKNAAGYQECILLEHALASDACLVYGENGQLLSTLYGGPLRLIMFNQVLQKSLPQLIHLDFTADPIDSYSETLGLTTGDIQPGQYYAFDQGNFQPVHQPGEVTGY